MPGFTTPDGFIYPVKGDRPYTGLSPDVPGSFAVFQEQVQTKFTAHGGDISALSDRVTALEAAVAASRWRHIAEGTQSGGNSFDIAVPAGYSRLHLSLVGDLTALGPVNIRINGNTGTNYQRGFLFWNASGAQEPPEYNGSTTLVKVAEWSSTEANKAEVDIAVADGSQGVAIQAYSTRTTSQNATGHEIQFGWGKYVPAAVVSSVRVLTNGPQDFAAVRWYLEGFLLP